MEQEMGEMHWSNGWMFKRLDDGSVRIRKHAHTSSGEGAGIHQAVIPAAEWVSLLHHLAHEQTAETFEAARQLHGTV